MKIYLAGPLFSAAEREFNARLATLLRAAGHEIWLPQERQGPTAAETFKIDVEGIDWADVVVANMDGADPDSGTCWECGYAYGKKPVVVFRTDVRVGKRPETEAYNLMLLESATGRLLLPFASTTTVAERISAAVATLSRPIPSSAPAPRSRGYRRSDRPAS